MNYLAYIGFYFNRGPNIYPISVGILDLDTNRYDCNGFDNEWDAMSWLTNHAPGYKRITWDQFEPYLDRSYELRDLSDREL